MYEFELRHYDAAIGRFVTTDPYEQFMSPYIAMGNNPIVSFDPDGGNCFDINGNSIACPNDDLHDEFRDNPDNHITILDAAGGVAEHPNNKQENDSEILDADKVKVVQAKKFFDAHTDDLAKVTVLTAGAIALSDGPAPVADVPAAGTLISGLALVALLQATENFVNTNHGLLEGLFDAASDNSKNERHGDKNAESKVERQLAELEAQLQTATGNAKKKIKQKIQNIKKTARDNKKGESHNQKTKKR